MSRDEYIEQARQILASLGLPQGQQNDRSALCLLALLNLTPGKEWAEAEAPLLGITPLMDWVREHYQKEYKPNTRETIRRQTMHQFVAAGIALYNPDDSGRPPNSPKAVYQIAPEALSLLISFGTPAWDDRLAELDVEVDSHGKMPDVVLYYVQKNWLLLVEAVTSHGPVDGKRHEELTKLFAGAKAGLIYATAFPSRAIMARYLGEIAWETEVWGRAGACEWLFSRLQVFRLNLISPRGRGTCNCFTLQKQTHESVTSSENAPSHRLMNIAVVGLSHRTAPVEVREKLSIQDHALEEAIAHLMRLPHVSEVAVLSTCNRLEIYAVASDSGKGAVEIAQFLSEHSDIPLDYLRRYLFTLLHQDACRHLMRVAAGLDSLVLGEGQILSQVKHTHKLGQKYKGIGRLLDRLFKQALSAGKSVRSNTNIGTGAMSISSAAVELVQTKVENLGDRAIAIIGAGKMSRLLVQHLASKGAARLTIVNRSQQRAAELASQFPSIPIAIAPLDGMMEAIAAADVVFTSTSACEPILNRAQLTPHVPGDRALLLCDISVPRNVAADVSEMAGVQSYNVDDLKAVVAKNAAARRKMAQEAEASLEVEIEAFEAWWRSLDAVPTISCLRDKIETIRTQELEKALSRLGTDFSEKHKDIVEALTRGIVNKILHEPMVELRSQQDEALRRQTLSSLQLLFNLQAEASQ